ncbi:hypothetical protein EV401DRAFT_792944 [Pisolithus croceorrhizus]|nr:hypothetical protein EV401DRAFT_792944 [Pisolithus croceorrhizus]
MSIPSDPSCAPSPFDHVKADVILRSSDDIDFRVFKSFLSLASPFFETLFDLPQPSEEMNTDVEIKDGLPVACRACMQDECALAAKHTLREPLVPTWFEEIELITSSELLSLLSYHEKCGDAVQLLKDDLSWITAEYRQWNAAPWMFGMYSGSGYCGCTLSTSGRLTLQGHSSAQWWETFIDSTVLDLRDRPCAGTIQRNVEKAIQTVRQRNCRYCSSSAPGGLREFAALFTNRVEELIATVELDLKF